MDAQTQFNDPAKPILANDPAVTDAQRADAWDAWHSAKNETELAQHPAILAMPEDTRKKLIGAKQLATPVPDPVAKTKDIMTQLSQMDPQVLDAAEQHPNVLKLLSAAAGIGAKPTEKPAGSGKAASKGNTPAGPSSAPAVTPDYPPTPPGHAFVKASDGAHYHIPVANVAKAKTVDPYLKVLHVEPDETEA